MEIEYVHFYVDDASVWRQWFVHRLGFCSAGSWREHDSRHERVFSGGVRFLLSSALLPSSPVADYLAQHPPGVVDVALRVTDLQAILQRAQDVGARILQGHGLEEQSPFPWVTLSGWGALKHTLVEAGPRGAVDPPWSSDVLDGVALPPQFCWPAPSLADVFQHIDHVVLNVAAGALTQAVDWYSRLFALRSSQSFHIQTPYSGLRSQVLVGDGVWSEPVSPGPLSPEQFGSEQSDLEEFRASAFGAGGQPLQMPINEPESSTSQIQDFLDHNQGSGVQHIALATQVLPTVARLRQQQVDFLAVPPSYYHQLPLRPRFELQGLGADWADIVAQQVLVDWHAERWDEGPLLQIFTRPIFEQPTFFFEFIERRKAIFEESLTKNHGSVDIAGRLSVQGHVFCASRGGGHRAQGFGEGNFQALFEAMEREQRSRQMVAPQSSSA